LFNLRLRPCIASGEFTRVAWRTRCRPGQLLFFARSVPACGLKAKFHYTDPTGPARTLSATRTDPTEFRRKKSPCGSGRVRVVEFSYYILLCRWLDVVSVSSSPPYAAPYSTDRRRAALSRSVCISLRLCLCVSVSSTTFVLSAVPTTAAPLTVDRALDDVRAASLEFCRATAWSRDDRNSVHWRRQGGPRGPRPPNGRAIIFFVKIDGLLEPVVLNLSFRVRSKAMFTF